jgi:hypothetical protein
MELQDFVVQPVLRERVVQLVQRVNANASALMKKLLQSPPKLQRRLQLPPRRRLLPPRKPPQPKYLKISP